MDRQLIYVQVRLNNTSQAMEFHNALNTYTKGDLYCVYLNDERVKKFPIQSIFDITENYGEHP